MEQMVHDNAVASGSTVKDEHRGGQPKLDRIVIAYDGSPSSRRALDDAETLAFRYHAEVFILSVDGPPSVSQQTTLSDEAKASLQLAAHGVHNQCVHRIGEVDDMVRRVCEETSADLLMLGAYGHGNQDRETLGSSAERLLRAEVCPVVTYGPAVASPLFASDHQGPVLLPLSLACLETQLSRALDLAKLFKVRLAVFHVVKPSHHQDGRHLEHECLEIAQTFRAQGVPAQWHLVYGDPALLINSMSLSLKSPFILLPLNRRRSSLSAETSDNVAAHVIRRAKVPVVSYSFG